LLSDIFRRPPPARGVAIGYDELMRSLVHDPSDVPIRHTKREIAEQLEALYDQYDMEDFDLGIKQFMIEQAIQQVLSRAGS
jgi:cell division protease FtsH